MIVFPAMDLFDGNVVKLEAKEHKRPEKVYGTPEQVAKRWLSAGAEWLHVVDLNAALGQGTSAAQALLAILPLAAKFNAKVQLGGGMRSEVAIQFALRTSIARIIVGTQAIRDAGWLREVAQKHPDRIVVAIDGKGREVLVGGWQEKAGVDVVEFLRKVADLSLAGFLYTNVSVEGRGEGVEWGPVNAVLGSSSKPVIFSGGITTLEDVANFKRLGAYGIIIGSALYSGKIDFAEAQALAR